MNTVTAGQVAAAFNGGPPLPPNAVMISFDDGRTDAMLYADPLLKQAHMRATMFVITGAALKHGVYYASWDELKYYARSGRWDIEAHTSGSHYLQKVAGSGRPLPALTSLAPGETLEQYRARIHEDLARARDSIQENLGMPPVTLAYPFGAYGADRTNDPAIETILRDEVGKLYRLAFEQEDQDTVPLVSCEQDLLRLRRLEVKDWSATDLLSRVGLAARLSAGVRKPCPAKG
jgi:peptidoglycan/xylan/chitin deacetylase (PgdA/CDA1 family)